MSDKIHIVRTLLGNSFCPSTVEATVVGDAKQVVVTLREGNYAIALTESMLDQLLELADLAKLFQKEIGQ